MDEHGNASCRGCGTPGSQLIDAAGAAATEGIGRRTFLAQTGILAAIAALNACGMGGGGGVTAPTLSGSTSINIANYPALANVGGVAVLDIGSAPLAVVRTGTSSFVALSRVCPHQGGIVQLYNSDFVCPQHGATFNLSGQWVGGQRTSNLHTYPTSYDATSGTLTIG